MEILVLHQNICIVPVRIHEPNVEDRETVNLARGKEVRRDVPRHVVVLHKALQRADLPIDPKR
jgi:hypothetical protein